MGKARSQVKRVHKFNYNANRKKTWQKKKKLPEIINPALKNAWDPKKSTEENLKLMGLAADPNKTLAIDETKNLVDPKRKRKQSLKQDVVMGELKVADILERAATTTIPDATPRLSEPEMTFCMEMIEKHGDDYQAMAADATNYYQETAKQIKRKITTFRKYPGPHVEFLRSRNLAMDTS